MPSVWRADEARHFSSCRLLSPGCGRLSARQAVSTTTTGRAFGRRVGRPSVSARFRRTGMTRRWLGPTAANLPSAELPAAGLSAGGRSPVAARAPCACVPFPNTMQVSRPVAKAPVSMLMRLGRISGSATGVWPCTTILPKSARLLRNSPRIHSKSCSLCRSRGIPGRTPASRARSPRSHFEQIEAPVDVADRVDE
jgi:hypothetical protein